VRERRLALGLTQQQLAGLVGITFQQVHKHEKGINRIAAGRLHAIARALGVEPGDFFEGLGGGGPDRLPDGQRRLLELTRHFTALSRRHREALAGLARALAGVDAGPREGEEVA
jgi:transcriptional regulator with XRE-family HTH domain